MYILPFINTCNEIPTCVDVKNALVLKKKKKKDKLLESGYANIGLKNCII